MRFMALPALIFTVVPILRNPLKSVGIYQMRSASPRLYVNAVPLLRTGSSSNATPRRVSGGRVLVVSTM